jgi:transcriptional regulator GlxA family with amidase domain
MVPGLDGMFGRKVAAQNPALRLLMRYLALVTDADELGQPELQPGVVKHVHELLALTLGASREAAIEASLGGARAARLRQIKNDIERAIGREEVSIGVIATRHCMEVRSVQRLFEAEGATFTEYVHGRRLARAYAMLTDPRHRHLPIGTVALEAGFGDPAYFARSFRNRYGASPSEVRAGEARDRRKP